MKSRKEYHRQYYIANRERVLARNTAWQKRSGHKIAARARERVYGLTKEAFSVLLGEQMGCCKTCGHSLSMKRGGSYALNVDHDHKTGRVRGLLCNRCNVAIGLIYDSVKTLNRMIAYLEAE
jgi:Recombination endonuclease VII